MTAQSEFSDRLMGKTALISGGVGGIGMAIARRFIGEGATVYIADLMPESDDHVTDTCAKLGGGVRYLRLDVTAETQWKSAEAALRQNGNGLDILVNNAGVAPTGTVDAINVEDWRRTIDVNLDGVFLGVRVLAALLAETGSKRKKASSIINMSSVLGMVSLPETTAYSASKGAVRLFTKACAVEFAHGGRPIRVNSLHPGFVRTPMTEKGSADMSQSGALPISADPLADLAAQVPMGRIADADEIAAAALFLASDDASYVTGAELVVDGGWTAQ